MVTIGIGTGATIFIAGNYVMPSFLQRAKFSSQSIAPILKIPLYWFVHSSILGAKSLENPSALN